MLKRLMDPRVKPAGDEPMITAQASIGNPL
jgi:hypothetical protein